MGLGTAIRNFATRHATALTVASTGVLASAMVGGAVMELAAASVGEFPDYEPLTNMRITWYEQDSQGEPTWCVEYPYRVVLTGGYYRSGTLHRYFFIIFSKKASLSDDWIFEYDDAKNDFSTPRHGYIGARCTSGYNTDYRVMYQSYTGGIMNVFQVSNLAQYQYTQFSNLGNKHLYFDHVWQCETNTGGVYNVPDVPYHYILNCGEHGGSSSGGGQESSGGSSGGGSSGGSHGGGSGGNGSGSKPLPPWEESQGGGSGGGKYPWQDESSQLDLDGSQSVPDYTDQGEGDTGENGDGWTLPEWSGPESLPGGDINIPPMPDMSFPEWPEPDFSFPELPEPDFSFPESPSMPETSFIEPGYQPSERDSWPPPFPGTNGY